MSIRNLHESAQVVNSLPSDARLAFSRIFQQTESNNYVRFGDKGFLLYPRGVKFQASKPKESYGPAPTRTRITGFSDNSRRRLRFVAVNAFPALTSQFVLTYHNDFPTDGKASKKHLNAFLVSFRREFPKAPYLWILEFQGRGAPHYHLFTDLEVNDENSEKLVKLWCRLLDPDRLDNSLWDFHRTSFRAWDMGNGTYVAKYLEKERQKDVPENFKNVGRFWGASRGLVPMPVKVGYDEFSEQYSFVDVQTGEIKDGLLLSQRWLGKWFERQVKQRTFAQRKEERKKIYIINSVLPKDKKKPFPKYLNYRRNFRKFAIHKGFTLVTGQEVFCQIERYLAKERNYSYVYFRTIAEKGLRSPYRTIDNPPF